MSTGKVPRFNWNMGFDPKYSGWIPPEERTVEMQKQHEAMVRDTPRFTEVFTGNYYDKNRPRQWELIGDAIKRGFVPPEYIRNGTLKNIYQQTGSCVWAGAANCLFWASVVDAIELNQPEKIIFPSLYHYGRGRLASGIRGRGEGSTGSGQAEALQKDGYLDWDVMDQPRPEIGETVKWTASQEMQWSDGAAIAERYITEARQKRIANVVRMESLDDCQAYCDTYRTFTVASDWGGLMQCPVKDGVLLNRKSAVWWHQMWILDYILHRILGRLWAVGNNWAYVHGIDPGGEWDNGYGLPPGCFYIGDSDLSHMLRHREVYGFLDLPGTADPRRKFNWQMG